MEIIKYATVFGLSMLKFILGILTGTSLGFNIGLTALLTVAGMMATVVILTFLGNEFRQKIKAKFGKNKKLFTSKNRKIVRVWQKYGIFGVAFLTPLLFSPIVGTLIAVSFGEKKHKILIYMLLSAVFWGLILSVFIHFFGEKLFNF